MLIIRDFRCEDPKCNTLHERMVEKEITQIVCPNCGHTAVKVLSPTYGRVLGIREDELDDPMLL